MQWTSAIGTILLAAGLAVCGSRDIAAEGTHGPNGEPATPASALSLSDAEVAKIKSGSYTAALLWHTSSDFTIALTAGVTDELARLGVSVVATTDAGFDPARQKNDVETVMVRKPSVILTLPVDPVSGAATFRPAVDAGVKLVFLSNVPAGYKQGKDFVAVVTDDLFQMGKQAADLLAVSIGRKGKVGYVFHDVTYYVTNQRDQAFEKTIERDYPNIRIVARQGIVDPASAEELAEAMLLRAPDLDGVYVTWAEPAEGVLSALRNAGNRHTKLVTLDLSEPLALDMVKGGNVVGIVADQAYALGRAMAEAAGYGLLRKPAPAFLIVPALSVTKANIADAWQISLHRAAPSSVLEAAKLGSGH
jgi:ribose transport system substrate-binding protein